MDGKVSPFLGMWGPNILLLVAGLYLFVKSLQGSAPFPAWQELLRKRSGARRPGAPG